MLIEAIIEIPFIRCNSFLIIFTANISAKDNNILSVVVLREKYIKYRGWDKQILQKKNK